jgi:ABC-2 type transport system ATP-binding protein
VTIVFVTHDMDAVRQFCDRGVMIEGSRLTAEGDAETIAGAYARLFEAPPSEVSASVQETPAAGA